MHYLLAALPTTELPMAIVRRCWNYAPGRRFEASRRCSSFVTAPNRHFAGRRSSTSDWRRGRLLSLRISRTACTPCVDVGQRCLKQWCCTEKAA